MLKASAPEDSGQLCFHVLVMAVCFLSMHRELPKQGSELLSTWRGINNKGDHFTAYTAANVIAIFNLIFLPAFVLEDTDCFLCCPRTLGLKEEQYSWEKHRKTTEQCLWFFFQFSLQKKQVFDSVSFCLNSVLRDQPKKAWTN